ncbi:ras-domain-containing protein [Microthyrium microscopicum]|uniref:Ras-domain-containing protein n=1 Tax=Microthyrium microscopicum TaxID=703497 RepID=A0A6A6U7Y9_9PEZI|nr:ras-domain-containing protein [Microthyrium microscopicum]
MGRNRAQSNASSSSPTRDQELGTMYDYLAKIILLGPSGSGKSCILHRFVKDEWRILSSQTIGVEFASKVVKVGSGARRKRIKLQLWDTAGTERFRAVSRSYYRGAAGAILIYDITNHASFRALPTFLNDAKALASPNLTVILAGNKADLSQEHQEEGSLLDLDPDTPIPSSSYSSRASSFPNPSQSSVSSSVKDSPGFGSTNTVSKAPEGREVLPEEASGWASTQQIPVSVDVSAYSGANITEIFERLAAMILTKIELGEINPDDPQSGIQYGDSGWGFSDNASTKSGMTVDDGHSTMRRRRGRRTGGGWGGGLREWEEVFRLDGRRRNRCC